MARKTPSSQSETTNKDVVVRKAADKEMERKSAGPVEPKIIFRDKRELIHHLFKGELAVCIKSDKFGPIPVKRIEHVHHFHSHNSNGVPQKHCHAVAGHVHEWEWQADPVTGDLIAKCGPPLKKVVRPGRNGINKVSYERISVKNPDDGSMIPDNHQHQMTYLGSDVLTAEKIQAIQRNNSQRLGAPTQVEVNDAPKPPEGYQMVDADRKTTQE